MRYTFLGMCRRISFDILCSIPATMQFAASNFIAGIAHLDFYLRRVISPHEIWRCYCKNFTSYYLPLIYYQKSSNATKAFGMVNEISSLSYLLEKNDFPSLRPTKSKTTTTRAILVLTC